MIMASAARERRRVISPVSVVTQARAAPQPGHPRLPRPLRRRRPIT